MRNNPSIHSPSPSNITVALLAPASSIHTIRWANGLASLGLEVHLISLHEPLQKPDSSVKLHLLPQNAPYGYLSSLLEARSLISRISPTLLHAHYATGYGLLARIIGFTPTLLSIWGSDIYDFPKKSFVHKWLVTENLKSAHAIASTSHCMAKRAKSLYDHQSVFITPFGVDEVKFSKETMKRNDNCIVLGTVKSLKYIYGIDTLILAFAKAWTLLDKPHNLKLEITGTGPELARLEKIVLQEGIENIVTFHGYVAHSEIPHIIHRLDIYCALSRSESFGVSALEASACGKPVIVSNAEGLREVTIDGDTGVVVPKNDVAAAANAMIKLIQSSSLRESMGNSGRAHVINNYSWKRSLTTMLNAYCKIVNDFEKPEN